VFRVSVLLMVTAAVLACACGAPKPEVEQDLNGDREGGEEAVEAAAADTTEIPVLPDILVPARDPYRMAVGDIIGVRFFYYPAYNISLVVRPDGYVTIPLLGEVHAEGMRPSELEEAIRTRYAEVLVEPEVSVIVSEFANQRIFVFGEVLDPGAIDLRGASTILDAIAEAGGLTYNGRNDSIILIRQQPDGMFSGTRVNLQDLLAGRSAENIMLKPRDVVYVPMTFIAKVDVFVDQFFAKITPAWYFFIAGREVLNPEGRYIIGN
jgi:polysaccharide export outer membrane protein